MDSKEELDTRELSLATQLIWSSVKQIRDLIGKDAVLTRSGDVDGEPSFLIALPLSRWQLDGKTPIPKELIETEAPPVGNSEPESVGNLGALAIPAEADLPSVGNSEPESVGNLGALAIPEKKNG